MLAVAVPVIVTPVLGGGLTGRAGVPVSVYSQSTGAAGALGRALAAGAFGPFAALSIGTWPQPATSTPRDNSETNSSAAGCSGRAAWRRRGRGGFATTGAT
jgi:hypothetical protein